MNLPARLAAALTALIVLAACAALPASATAPARGDIVAVERLEALEQPALQAMADDFPGRPSVGGGAQLYRLTYWTELQGRKVIASGLVAAPTQARALKGVVLYAHGTTMTRALSPSQPDRADGDEEAAVFAGNAYLVVLPDYVGLGVSTVPQAYAIVRPQVDASADMLKAVRAWAGREGLGWNPSLMLMGFSQGGQTVAGLHRELERAPLDGYRLRGTVAVAGPHDLRGLSVRKTHAPDALELVNVGYLGLALTSYAHYYGVPLETAASPDYAGVLPVVFDGGKAVETIIPQLPSDARLLFQPAFLRALQANRSNWFTRALDDNQTWKWVPRAPLRIVYGDADIDVPAASSKALYDYAAPRGGAVTLHSMGRTDHAETAAKSYAPTVAWFDALAAGETR